MNDEELDKQCVWFNKEHLNDPCVLLDKLFEIKNIEMMYGTCFILTEDLKIDMLKKIFVHD